VLYKEIPGSPYGAYANNGLVSSMVLFHNWLIGAKYEEEGDTGK
jgi:hypothetical protein